MGVQKKIKRSIKVKILYLVLGISLLSMFLLLGTTQVSLQNESRNSLQLIESLKNHASLESEKGLKNQANKYLRRLVTSQAENSNYIFKMIEAQINMAHDYTVDLWDQDNVTTINKYEELRPVKKGEELIDNPELKFYYTLAPGVSKRRVKTELDLLSNLSTIFRSIVKNNKTMSILPLAIDGVYIGTETGIFYNMTWLAYYDETYDATTRPWYQEALKTKGIGWSDLYIDAAENEYIITCYKACYSKNGELIGVIGIDVNFNAMIEIITTQISDIGEAFLVNESGEILTYAELSSEMKDILGSGKNIADSTESDMKKLAQEIKLNQEGILDGRFNGKSKLLAYAAVKSTNWYIVFAGSTELIMEYIEKTKQEIDVAGDLLKKYSEGNFNKTIMFTLVIFIVILIFTEIILMKFSQRITNPLSILAEKVEKVGDGDLNETIDIKTGDEIELLATSFNKMTSDLKEYIKNLQETTAAKERIEGELQVANRIQASMLPRIFPPFPDRKDISIFGSMQPAKNVGGDYFDFFFINENRFCFTVGDVSGKGVPASLFMVISKVLVKNEALRNLPVDEIFCRANNMLCEDNDEFLFTTSVIFIIDLITGEMEYTNAGHNPPLIYRAAEGRFSYMEPQKGFVLGGMPDFKYTLEKGKLEEGDIVFTYSDGVTEAMDPDNNQYSEQRLIDKLNSIELKDVNNIEKLIKEDIISFVNGAEQSDDITMLIFKYEGK